MSSSSWATSCGRVSAPSPRLVDAWVRSEFAAQRYFVTQAKTKNATTSVPTTISKTGSPTAPPTLLPPTGTQRPAGIRPRACLLTQSLHSAPRSSYMWCDGRGAGGLAYDGEHGGGLRLSGGPARGRRARPPNAAKSSSGCDERTLGRRVLPLPALTAPHGSANCSERSGAQDRANKPTPAVWEQGPVRSASLGWRAHRPWHVQSEHPRELISGCRRRVRIRRHPAEREEERHAQRKKSPPHRPPLVPSARPLWRDGAAYASKLELSSHRRGPGGCLNAACPALTRWSRPRRKHDALERSCLDGRSRRVSWWGSAGSSPRRS